MNISRPGKKVSRYLQVVKLCRLMGGTTSKNHQMQRDGYFTYSDFMAKLWHYMGEITTKHS